MSSDCLFIRRCRGLDMTLDEIRVLLHFKESPQENCADVNRLLDRHIGHVAQRMQELQELERQLKDLRERCGEARDAAHCGILDGLSQAIVPWRQDGIPRSGNASACCKPQLGEG
jgi:hypothetical protein